MFLKILRLSQLGIHVIVSENSVGQAALCGSCAHPHRCSFAISGLYPSTPPAGVLLGRRGTWEKVNTSQGT